MARESDLRNSGIAAVTRIGDSMAPGAIVHAVHSGHLFARDFDNLPAAESAPYVRDFPL
jgi:dimethylamine/trimethylamine dehydrogenase